MNKRIIGVIIKAISLVAFGALLGFTMRRFGTEVLWYLIGLNVTIAGVLFGAYLESKQKNGGIT